MGLVKYDIVEPILEEAELASCKLSILPGMDSFTYMIVRAEAQLLAVRSFVPDETDAVQSTQEFLASVFEQDPYLRKTAYASIQVGHLTERITPVPLRLYSPSDAHTYLEQLTHLESDAGVAADRLEELEICLVYATLGTIQQTVERRFPQARHRHLLTTLLRAWALHDRREGARGVYLHVRDRNLRVAAITGNILQYVNTFTFLDARDFLYYTLLAYAQADWKPSEVPTYLCGEIFEDSTIYDQLRRYVPQTIFLEPPTELRIEAMARTYPPHFYYDLLTTLAL